jgi:hypothetical protein
MVGALCSNAMPSELLDPQIGHETKIRNQKVPVTSARHSAYIDYDDQFIYFMRCYCLLGCERWRPQIECFKVSKGYL